MAAITSIQIPNIAPARKGKVRDIFDLGDRLLLVASDRISAYDCIMPQGVPDKGAILTQLSKFWFDVLPEAKPHHMISSNVEDFPAPFHHYPEILRLRSMLAKKVEPLRVECVVRGYLSGSAWKEYQENQSICGIHLPAGLKESEQLPQPLFTPATKNDAGHDENISFDKTVEIVGGPVGEELRARSIALYLSASKRARERGVIIADTKFEFGMLKGKILLIDEILTPDSSRFWAVENYSPGGPQEALDKQFLRDYLNEIRWDRNPPPPNLPGRIIENTRKRYLEAYKMITGKEWNVHS